MPRAARIKKPKHRTEVRSYAFAMDVCAAGSRRLFESLHTCHELRNILAIERRDNRAAVREDANIPYLTKNDQYKQISALCHSEAKYKAVHSQVLQNVADRIDEGTRRWFDAMKEGQHHVAPPKPIERKKYKSFTYTQYGTAARIRNGMLELSKLGSFRLHDHRKIRGKKKSITIKWKDGRWFAVITAEIQVVDLYAPETDWANKPDAGMDPGLKSILNDSAGHCYATPKPLRAAQKKLKCAQQAMSRKFEARKREHQLLMKEVKSAGLAPVPLKEAPLSRRLKDQIQTVAKLHTKVTRTRDYAHKKNAAIASDRYRRVAVEEHSVSFMMSNRRTAKAASDVAIGGQKNALQSRLGLRYVATPNRRPELGGNSQTCLCGAPAPKKLSERHHYCKECGISGDRDWISANINQYIAFGTVHQSLARACGQQVLDKALALLETRGEGKALRGETRLGRKAISVESSVKRAPRVSRKSGKTAGGEPTAAGKTARHRKREILPGALPGCAEPPVVGSKSLSGSPRL